MTPDIYTYQLGVADAIGERNVWTFGIDLEGPITLILQCGDYMVWHVGANTVWTGVGSRGTKPASYMLMRQIKIKGYRAGMLGANLIDEIEPGKYWRQVRAAFIQKCKEKGQ